MVPAEPDPCACIRNDPGSCWSLSRTSPSYTPLIEPTPAATVIA
jgi:hypothetical protein